MDQPLRVCLVHAPGPLHDAFRSLGCETLLLCPAQAGVFDLPGALAAHGFTPDLVLQRERLGPRLLLAGLASLPCARAFWALDPHLNAFWQAPYARLFDLVLSTQRRWIPALQAHGAEGVEHLPWHAPEGPFIPHKSRARRVGFVGRLGASRPARTWLVNLMRTLLPQDFELRDDLNFDGMMEFYRATSVVPNESITGEVNFRLFEAAGCGCVVLAQDLGPEQAELYEPGREMLVCADALELAETATMLAKRPHLAEALGRAAWERSRRDHTAQARAETVLRLAAAAPRRGADAAGGQRWLALSLAGLFEAGRMEGIGPGLAAQLAALPGQDAPVLSARLRTAHTLGDGAAVADLRACSLAALSARPSMPHGLELSLACCASALGLGGRPQPADFGQARSFAGLSGVSPRADGPVELLLAWARRLEAEGVPGRGGFGFDTDAHLPACAAECLHCANALAPGHVPVLRATTDSLVGAWGVDVLRVGALSDLGLRLPDDWRVGLELGLCDLRVFRPVEGLSELAVAAGLAAARGESPAFDAALARADASGRIRRALAAGR